MDLYASPKEFEPLFATDFIPAESEPHKGTLDQPQIDTLIGRHNRILVGAPQIIDVVSAWPHNESLAEEIKSFIPSWDFNHIRFACSFEPDRGCRFSWARIGIELVPDTARDEAKEEAIAFDLFPRQIGQEYSYQRSFKIEPSLKFAFAEASLGVTSESEKLHYEPDIRASGLLTAYPAWTFQSTNRHGYTGIYEMFLLVKKLKGANIMARFKIGAEIHTRLGPLPVKRYREEELYDRLYPLNPG